jgi:Bacterial toxin 24
MGFENKTAQAVDNLVSTVSDLPNMTNEQKGAAAAALTVVVVEGVVTKKINPASKVKSIADQAQDLKKVNGGKNSVNVGTVNGKTHYDLDGAAHKGVETPHVQKSYNHTNPRTGETYLNKDRKDVRPMNQQDVRTVRKVLEKRSKN